MTIILLIMTILLIKTRILLTITSILLTLSIININHNDQYPSNNYKHSTRTYIGTTYYDAYTTRQLEFAIYTTYSVTTDAS